MNLHQLADQLEQAVYDSYSITSGIRRGSTKDAEDAAAAVDAAEQALAGAIPPLALTAEEAAACWPGLRNRPPKVLSYLLLAAALSNATHAYELGITPAVGGPCEVGTACTARLSVDEIRTEIALRAITPGRTVARVIWGEVGGGHDGRRAHLQSLRVDACGAPGAGSWFGPSADDGYRWTEGAKVHDFFARHGYQLIHHDQVYDAIIAAGYRLCDRPASPEHLHVFAEANIDAGTWQPLRQEGRVVDGVQVAFAVRTGI
jgi:hypothetical protein